MGAAIQVFEGHPVPTHTFRGRSCWLAQDIGAALGYTVRGFSRCLRDWSAELEDGSEIMVLRGANLREFKAGVQSTPASDLVTNLTILFDAGINVVCLKTDKPKGPQLRRWLARVVLPAIRDGRLREQTSERAELIALSLRLTAGDNDTIWERETVQELCRVHRKPLWESGPMPLWVKGPMGMIYRIVLGQSVYAELKSRNPDPRDGSLNYQFLTEGRHKLMQKDMQAVSALLRTSPSAREFFDRLRHAYKRAPLQLTWGG